MTNPKLHSAEHIFWQVLKNKLGFLKTRALQFTEEYCRFDFITTKELSGNDLEEITLTVNEVIARNLEVIIEKMPRQGAEKIVDLTLVPLSTGIIRIVRIGDFSVEACIGEHVKNTSEIGRFRIIEYKKIGENTFRIKFVLD